MALTVSWINNPRCQPPFPHRRLARPRCRSPSLPPCRCQSPSLRAALVSVTLPAVPALVSVTFSPAPRCQSPFPRPCGGPRWCQSPSPRAPAGRPRRCQSPSLPRCPGVSHPSRASPGASHPPAPRRCRSPSPRASPGDSHLSIKKGCPMPDSLFFTGYPPQSW